MKDILRIILNGLYVIRPYSDADGREQYRFNLKNPLGYILLLLTAIVVAIAEGATSFYRVLDETLTDAVRDIRSKGEYNVDEQEDIEQKAPLPPANGNQLYEDAMRQRDCWPEN